MTALADLILNYFLDQIRVTCFAGFSYFFANTKINSQSPSKNADCKIQITAKKNSNLRMLFPLIDIASIIDYPGFLVIQGKLLRPPSYLQYLCFT